MDAADVLFEALSGMVRNGLTVDEASRRLCLIQPAAIVKVAVRRYQDLVGQMVGGPSTLTGQGRGGWYPGPAPTDRFWPALRAHLLSKGWPEEDVNSLDQASSRVVSLLEHPGLIAFKTKGLVLGYVQSGKTANFTAVTAKAADAGYRLFIIMSGLTDKLRNQTQQRISRELHAHNPQHWAMLTDSDADFGGLASGTAAALLSDRHDQRVLCVVKKNPSRLTRLLTWLNGATDPVLSRCPVILIDDESDQASINTSTNPNRASTINALIREIVWTCPRVAYIGYTATPFSNVLISPAESQDLYPRDFIVDLDKPSAYFGPELVFGRQALPGEDGDVRDGLDVIRSVPLTELVQLQPQALTRGGFAPAITPSLRKALLYFWMATAARFARGQRSEHSSMLVHTTLFADAQERFKPVLEDFSNHVRNRLSVDDTDLVSELESIWTQECGAIDPSDLPEALRSSPTSFADLRVHLHDVMSATSVVVENYLTLREDRLDYTEDPGVFIVVGGNILSRGLTLEGLVTSFFVRTSSAYDTLLQMGRWFGYRRGYGDLPRIWMTDELKGYFFDLATVEAEIRQDIRRYEQEQATPVDFAPRIRTHPHLSITSRLKMQHAVAASVSYSQQRPQTIHFDVENESTLASNFAAARQLISSAAQRTPAERPFGRHWLWRRLSVSLVRSFIDSYAFHERSSTLRADLMHAYIEAENHLGALHEWNIGIVSREPTGKPIDIVPGVSVTLIERSRVKGAVPPNIKALMGPADMIVDLQPDTPRVMTSGEMWNLREAQAPGIGLLLLYLIDRRSAPDRGLRTREALNARSDVTGAAFVFPRGRSAEYNYMTADLQSLRVDDWEVDDQLVEDEDPTNGISRS